MSIQKINISPLSYNTSFQNHLTGIWTWIQGHPRTVALLTGTATLVGIGLIGVYFTRQKKAYYLEASEEHTNLLASLLRKSKILDDRIACRSYLQRSFSPEDCCHQGFEGAFQTYTDMAQAGKITPDKVKEKILRGILKSLPYKQLTREDAFTKLNAGICQGTANYLLDKCAYDGIELSKAVLSMQSTDVKENILFRQLNNYKIEILDILKDICEREIDIKKQHLIINKNHEQNSSDLEIQLTRINQVINFITRGFNSNSIKYKQKETKIFEFSINHILSNANDVINNLLTDFVKETTVQGSINLKHHVMAFECGPQGYYLFDTISEDLSGLYYFVNQERFAQAVSEFVNYALIDKEPTALSKKKVVFEITSSFPLNPSPCASSSSSSSSL